MELARPGSPRANPRRPDFEEEQNAQEQIQPQRVRVDLDSLLQAQAKQSEPQEPEEPEQGRTPNRTRVSMDELLGTTIRTAAPRVREMELEASMQLQEAYKTESPENISRIKSAANAFMKNFAKLGPGMMQTKALIEKRLHESWLGSAAAVAVPGVVSRTPVQAEQLYEAGGVMASWLEEAFPENPEYQQEFWAGTMAAGAGQMTAQVLLSLTGAGALGMGAKGVFALNTAFTSGMGAEYFEEALEGGADEDQAFDYMLRNIGTNAGLNALPMAAMIRRINRLTDKSLTKVLKAGFAGSVQEGITEGLQQWATNIHAMNIFDESRDLMQGVAEGALAGAILGGTASSLTTALARVKSEATSAEDLLEIDRTLQEVEGLVEKTGENRAKPLADLLQEENPNVVRAVAKAERLRRQVKLRTGQKTSFATQAQFDAVNAEIEARAKINKIYKETGKLAKERYRKIKDRLGDDFEGYTEWESRRKKVTLKTPATVVTKNGTHHEGGAVLRVEQKSKLRQLIDRYWSWYPGEKKVGEALQRANAQIGKELRTAQLNMIRLNEAIFKSQGVDSKWYKLQGSTLSKALQEGKISKEFMSTLEKSLTDKAARASLPIEVQSALSDLTRHIEKFQQRLIRLGIVDGDLKVAIEESMGVYVHRRYKAFEMPKEWNWENMPAGVKATAVTKMQKVLLKDMIAQAKEGKPVKTLNDKQLKVKAENELKKLLLNAKKPTVHSMFRNLEKQKQAMKKENADFLKSRQEWFGKELTDSPEIRAFLGEFTDVTSNYTHTVDALAHFIYKRVAFDKIARDFKGQLFFTQQQVVELGLDPELYSHQLATGTKSLIDTGDSGKGLLMHKDVADTFNNRFELPEGNVWSFLARYNMATKFAKTVLSFVTAVRNVTGGLMFMTYNGLLLNPKDWAHAKSSWHLAFNSLRSLDRRGLAEKSLQMEGLGLYGKSVKAGELLRTAQESKLLEKSALLPRSVKAGLDSPHGDATSTLMNLLQAGQETRGFVKTSLSQFIKGTAWFYRAGDDFVRLFMFEAEKARYKRNGAYQSDQQIADIVLDTYQNYDRVGRGWDRIRQFPFLGPFVSFPAEVVRTVGNSAILANKEINSTNLGERKIGYQRVAGMMTTITGISAAMAASMIRHGITDDEDTAYREMMPPWDKNSMLIYTSRGDGVVRYLNTSYTNPYAYLMDPIMAVIKGVQNEEEALQIAGRSLAELFSPILSKELFAQAVIEFGTNQKSTGSEVYNPQDKFGTKIQKSLLHFWGYFEPGTITSIRRGVEPFVDPSSERKKTDELMGLFGLRMLTLDVESSFGFRIRDLRQEVRNARRVYNSVKFADGATQSDIDQAFHRSNEAYESLFNRMERQVNSAMLLGIEWETLDKIMDESGLAQRDREALRRGQFVPFER